MTLKDAVAITSQAVLKLDTKVNTVIEDFRALQKQVAALAAHMNAMHANPLGPVYGPTSLLDPKPASPDLIKDVTKHLTLTPVHAWVWHHAENEPGSSFKRWQAASALTRKLGPTVEELPARTSTDGTGAQTHYPASYILTIRIVEGPMAYFTLRAAQPSLADAQALALRLHAMLTNSPDVKTVVSEVQKSTR
jgi:hypothetical protein